MLASVFVAFEEDGLHDEVLAEFYVGEGVSDDEASGWSDARELGLCLFEEAGQGFTAVAFALVVRAEVEAVDVSTEVRESLLKLVVDCFDIRDGVEVEGDAALVGYDEYTQSCLVECCDGLRHSWQYVKVLPAAYVLAFGHLAVDDPVTVQEDGLQGRAKAGGLVRVLGTVLLRAFWLFVHPAMIAISECWVLFGNAG